MAEGGQPRPVQDGGQDYTFRNIELLKNETLGTGSYGAVCKAKCDELICAAKLLYPVLFEMQPQAPEPGKEHRQPFRRFELECRFLSRISHPNVVQYLGTYHDPDTNAPVLLMELVDESLTHFLESSQGPIPYQVQVNLCYDIAQALAFLHSNGIIHRDLSSNNVLLIAGSRAKVTDFGMSKFADIAATRLATMTKCPGTPAFMSPEALNEPPVYTEKLDSFSLGVVMVQVVTRKFPEPANRFETRELFINPHDPTRTVRAQVPVPEAERRHAHIGLIDPTHPLLPIALHCLKDEDVERPSSQQLCQTLSALKETDMYEQSSQQDKNQLLRAKDEHILTQTQEIVVKTQQLEAKETVNLELTERLEQSTRDNLVLQNEAETNKRQLSRLNQQVESNEEVTAAKDEQILTQTQDIVVKTQQLEAKETVNQKLTERLEQSTRDILVLQNEAETKERQLRRLNQQVEFNEEITAALQHSITQNKREVSELQNVLSSKDDQIRDISNQLERVSLRGELHPQQPTVQETPVGVKRVNLVWESLPKPPIAFDIDLYLQSSAVHGNKAYFSGLFSKVVVEYNCETKLWCEMPALPITRFTIVCVDHMLTSVGGRDDGWFGGSYTNKVYSLIDKKWVNHFPAMKGKRKEPVAVYANNILVVAGGVGSDSEPVSMIEVLNTQTKQWSTTSSLLIKMHQASVLAFCGDHFYIAGRSHPQDTTPMFKCSRLALIASTQKLQTNVWEEVACVPVISFSLATVNGHLLSIGGNDSQRKPTADIHQYNPTINSWEVVSQMSVASYSFLVAVLPGNKIMIIRRGERFGTTFEVEVATF